MGFEISPPSEVSIQPHGTAIGCRQVRADGEPIGELEVEVLHAALVIDRDGILEEKVQDAITRVAPAGASVLEAMPIELPGASGFRADAEPRPGVAAPPLPYVHVFAVASDDLGVDGGLLVTVRSASPEWPAADVILRSLRVLSRRTTTANDP